MKFDFDKPLVLRGVPVALQADKQSTLGEACRLILNAPPPEGARYPLEDMLRRGRLAMRIADGGEQDMTPEEVTLLRDGLASTFSHPELVVVLYDMLGG